HRRRVHVVGRRAFLLQRLGQRLERQVVPLQVLLELPRDQAQHAGRAIVVAAAHAPVPTRSSAGMWHFLYFFPLPHGQGSLRPTRGWARTGCGEPDAACGSRAAAPVAPAPARAGEPAGAGLVAAPALPKASASACCATIWRGWRGASEITCPAAAGCTWTRNSPRTKASP